MAGTLLLTVMLLQACGGGGGDDGSGSGNGGGSGGGGGQGTEPPLVSISGGEIAEGNAGTADLVFTVTLSSAASAEVTADYVTASQSAAAGDDYLEADDTLAIPAGQTAANIAVSVAGDVCYEDDETFTVTLTGVSSNAVLDAAVATGTIRDDDMQPELSIADAELPEGDDGTSEMVFALTLDRASCDDIDGGYSTNSVTADEDDLEIVTGVFSVPAGARDGEIRVAIFGDEEYETDETFTVSLDSVPSLVTAADAEAFGTIRTDDFPPVAVRPAEIVEGDDGTRTMVFAVELAGITNEISLDYATSDMTATVADQDYVAGDGRLTIPAAVMATTIEIDVVGDTKPEFDEKFLVTLDNLTGDAVLNPGTDRAEGTIEDDDTVIILDPEVSVPPAFGFEEGDDPASTSELIFQFTLNVPVGGDVVLEYETADLSAVAGADYDAASGTVTVPAGETVATVPVTVRGDADEEGPESFALQLNLLTPNLVVLLTPQAIGTILDDDFSGPPFLSVQPVEIFEGDDGEREMTAFVTLGGPASDTVTVDYATRDATALAGSDYAATGGTLTFPPGETIRTFAVTIFGDTVIEADERFELVLSNLAGDAILFDGTADATIRTDDPFALVSIGDVVLVEGDSGSSEMLFTVSLDAPAADPVTMSYASADATNGNSATANEDYVPVSGMLNVPAGDTEAMISVDVNGDTDNEFDETFTITLSNISQNAELADAVATGRIVNDDETPGWGLAQYFASSRFDNVLPKIAMNAAGEATIVWAPNGPGPYTSSRYAGGWGPLETPPETLVSGVARVDRSHVIDGAGNSTLAWAMVPEAAHHDPAAGWDATPFAFNAGSNRAEYVALAGNEAGRVIAVWKQNDPAGTTVDHLMHSAYDPDTGQWSAADFIVFQGSVIFTPDVAMNENGEAAAVWRESTIRASVYDPGSGQWSMPLAISDELAPGIFQPGYAPRVAVDGEGNAIAVWDSGLSIGTSVIGNIWTARYDASAGQWSDPVPIDLAALDATNAQVAVDAAGNAFIAWLQDNDDTDGFNDSFAIYARRYDASAAAWGPVELVHDADIRTSSAAIDLSYDALDLPALAVDRAGNALLAWSEEINGEFVIRASRYDTAAPQPGWGAPEPVSDDAFPFAMFPDIAVDAAGNAIVVWQAGDSSLFDRTDISEIGWNRYVAP